MMARAFHLNLDDAWAPDTLGLEIVDATKWGPRLRFSAPSREVEGFFTEYQNRLGAFTLFGSGDFHHLTALWLRRAHESITLVSFDNHPDWDVRPPRWACGGWINRALELPQVEKVSIWGCGNFECWWPAQLFGNRRAEREGKIEVHAWSDDRPPNKNKRRGAIRYATWREDFERFANELRGRNVYVTIDIDCLRAGEAMTNWENGKFTTDDVGWALQKLRAAARIVGGDLCGAYSPPQYARRKQRFVAEWDHPKLPRPDLAEARRINFAALKKLWPILTE
ncbi:MAG: hypothetical protein ACXWAV_10210 [Chthoniobacterales bacterium]